jgi:hypothetical protein
MLVASEEKVSAILRKILPASRQWIIEDDVFSHFLLMAFDGLGMHARLSGPERRIEETIDMLCEFILGVAERAPKEEAQPSASAVAARPARRKRGPPGEP